MDYLFNGVYSIVGLAVIAFLIWAIVHPIKRVSKNPSDKLSTETTEAKSEKMNKRYLLWAALIVAVVTAVRPMFWLGLIGFAGLMVVLAIFTGLIVYYLISLKKGSLPQVFGFSFLIVVIICAAITLKNYAPELSANEVKTIMNYRLNSGKVTSVEYRGDSIWKIKWIRADGVVYLYYVENVSYFSSEDEARTYSWISNMKKGNK